MVRTEPSHPLRAALGDYRLALGSRAYRRLWLAAVISRTGDTMNFTALPLFIFGLTRSPAAVGTVVFAEGVGLIAGGILAQSIVDRLPARRLLVTLDLFRAAAAVLLVIFPTFPTAVAVSLLLGLGTASFAPLSNAVVPRLVSNRALVAANGLQWTAGVLLQLVAAPVAGLLVAAGDARLAFALNAASFVTSGVVLLGLPYLPRIHEKPASAWQQLPELLAAVPRLPVLPPLLAMQGLAALAVGATSALLVVLARDAYGLSGTGYGLWLSAIAAGALVGPRPSSAFMGSIRRRGWSPIKPWCNERFPATSGGGCSRCSMWSGKPDVLPQSPSGRSWPRASAFVLFLFLAEPYLSWPARSDSPASGGSPMRRLAPFDTYIAVNRRPKLA